METFIVFSNVYHSIPNNDECSFSQILYFQMCEIVLLPPGQKATYLYTLMFYNVMSYCANYLLEVYRRKNWSPYVTITETSQVRHLAMSATKITLEWTKVRITKV